MKYVSSLAMFRPFRSFVANCNDARVLCIQGFLCFRIDGVRQMRTMHVLPVRVPEHERVLVYKFQCDHRFQLDPMNPSSSPRHHMHV